MPDSTTTSPATAEKPHKLDDVMIAMDVVDTIRHSDDLVRRELNDGAREGAPFIENHIIRVTEKAFDDFAGGTVDKAQIRRTLGLGRR